MRSSLRQLLTRSSRASDPSRPRRHPLLAVLASVAAVALGAGGLLLATAAPAEAHDGTATATCYTITPNYHDYNASLGPNTITISYSNLDGSHTVSTGPVNFTQSYTTPVTISDPGVGHLWTVDVHSSDRPTNNPTQWDRHVTGTTTGCATPAATVVPAACTAVNGTTTAVSATFANLDPSRTWDAVLTATGVSVSKPGVVNGTVSFGPQPTGKTYTVTVTDRANPTTTFTSAPVLARGCPKVGGVSFTIQYCTTPGGSAGVTVVSSPAFVGGRAYQLLVGGQNGTPVSPVYTAATGDTTHSFPVNPTSVPAGADLALVDVTDAQAHVLVEDFGAVDLQTCPSTPTGLTATPAACTIGATTSDISFTVSGLTQGRAYDAKLTGATTSVISFTADATGGYANRFTGAAPGQYSLQVIDHVTGTASSPASVTVPHCATQPKLSVATAQCTVPGGSGTLTVSLTDTTATRSYTVTVKDGQTVVGTPTTVVASGPTTAVPAFTGLTAGKQYSVSVVDAGEPRANATTTASLSDCPTVPKLSAVVLTCNAQNGTSTLQASTSSLSPSVTWTASLAKQGPTGAFVPVAGTSRTVTSAADLTFAGVQNGATYQVTLTAADNSALTAQTTVLARRCAVDSFSIENPPTQLSATLARTGADATLPVIGGVVLLQLGLALVAVGIIRRRRQESN